ncbi:MAG TPA: hypothetical protein VK658_02100 [Chryseolinea sp.]|nr:hypothetical protein [Chryseolinea sp.]
MHLNDTIREMIGSAFGEEGGGTSLKTGARESLKTGSSEGTSLKTGANEANECLKTGARGLARGLCQSCMKRATCSRTERSVGVWHCEEYF